MRMLRHACTAVLLLSTPTEARTPVPSSTLTQASPTPAADQCNITSKMPGDGDAAVAFTACVSTGKSIIWFPPGKYVVKTLAATDPAHNLPSTAFVLSGAKNAQVFAYGATFTMADELTTGSDSYFVAWNNSKSVGWHGGRFMINPFSSSGKDPVLNGMCWQSVTNLTIEGVHIDGNGANSSGFCGVYGFDVRVLDSTVVGVSLGGDFAYNENLTFRHNYLRAGKLASLGLSNIADPATYKTANNVTNANGMPRELRNGQSNQLLYVDNTIVGFHTAELFDDVNGAISRDNHLEGPESPWISGNNCGLLISVSIITNSQGFGTRDILSSGDVIRGNGNKANSLKNAGVLLVTNDFPGLTNIRLAHDLIYDNCGSGIGMVTAGRMGIITLHRIDFASRGGACKQTVAIAAPLKELLTGR